MFTLCSRPVVEVPIGSKGKPFPVGKCSARPQRCSRKKVVKNIKHQQKGQLNFSPKNKDYKRSSFECEFLVTVRGEDKFFYNFRTSR